MRCYLGEREHIRCSTWEPRILTRKEGELEFEQLYQDPGSAHFEEDVLYGLSQTPPSIPYYYFYDGRGSELFDRITEAPEYYVTNCEREILAHCSRDILMRSGTPSEIVEFGSGSAEKTRHLLRAALEIHPQVCFVPIDISADALHAAAEELIREFPRLNVHALAAEYRQGLEALSPEGPPRLFLFLGSSMGNLPDLEASAFLRRILKIVRAGDRVLIGVDLAKDASIIEPAYNDAGGVTASFNTNVLNRINNELDGNFNLENWRHEAPYLPELGHVEMRLVAREDQTVSVAGRKFDFKKGDYIWTERSRKYTEERLDKIVQTGGFETAESWYDSKRWFTVRLLQPSALQA